MRVARHCDAHCLLVADIDRGGAFAHLYGTWALLPPDEQSLIKGFVLNKFRGDAALLAPAPQMLQDMTGVPTVACIPMQFQHGLPEEDGVFDDRGSGGMGQAVHTCIAIVAYPRISNLDEFQPLLQLPGVRVVWARTPAQLSDADWVILPGSKATAADLAWMRQQGLDAAVARHAQAGKRVLVLRRPADAGRGPRRSAWRGWQCRRPGAAALGDLVCAAKNVQPTRLVLPQVQAPWQALSGLEVTGYEIHHGQTQLRADMQAGAAQPAQELLPGLLWQGGAPQVLGSYVHGLFENAAVIHALFGHDAPSLDEVFARMAKGVGAWFGDRLP